MNQPTQNLLTIPKVIAIFKKRWKIVIAAGVGGGLKVQRLAGEKAVRKCSAQMILRGESRRMTGVIRADLGTHRRGRRCFATWTSGLKFVAVC